MAYFSTEERISIIKLYYKYPKEYDKIGDLWSEEHRKKPKPSKKVIENFIEFFELNGTVKHEIKIMLDPMTGELIPYKDTDKCPYLIQTMAHMNKPNPEIRANMAEYLLQKDNLDHIWFTGKAKFCLSGYVYRDIYRFLGTSNPGQVTVNPLDDETISVYAAWCDKTLLGPYFISNNLNVLEYREFLEDRILVDIREKEMDTDKFIFMHDVPDDLKTQDIFYSLTYRFGDQVLADKCHQMVDYGRDWPNFSPDMNPIDFYLWGCIKDKIDEIKPGTINKLVEVIEKKFKELNSSFSFIEILKKRLEYVKKSHGWHFEKTFC